MWEEESKVELLQTLYNDCCLALSDDWDRSDTGFKVMMELLQELARRENAELD